MMAKPYYLLLATSLLSIVLHGAPASAVVGPSCGSLFQPSAFNVDGFSPKDARLITGVTSRIQRMSTALNYPIVSVRVGPKPSYFSESGVITLKRVAKHSLARGLSMVKYAHQYGYAIFDGNLRVLFEDQLVPLADVYRILRDRKAELLNSPEYLAEVERLTAIKQFRNANYKTLAPGGPTTRELENQIAALKSTLLKNHSKQSAVVLRMREWLEPHQALFSDLVAVVVAGEGNAVSQALQPYNEEGAHPDTESIPWSRDFTKLVSAKNFSVPLDSPFGGTAPARHYQLLDPVRSHIWLKYLSKPGFKEHGRLFEAFIEASSVQLRIHSADVRSFHPKNVEALNRELIRLLDDAFEN